MHDDVVEKPSILGGSPFVPTDGVLGNERHHVRRRRAGMSVTLSRGGDGLAVNAPAPRLCWNARWCGGSAMLPTTLTTWQ